MKKGKRKTRYIWTNLKELNLQTLALAFSTSPEQNEWIVAKHFILKRATQLFRLHHSETLSLAFIKIKAYTANLAFIKIKSYTANRMKYP